MNLSKLVKAFIIGICVSTLSTGIAFAEDSKLIQKQSEIDKYVFEEHVAEIAEMGFAVTYTGVTDDFVEIGITPNNETNANYLYKIFGTEMVTVIEGDQSLMYTSSEPILDTTVTGTANDQAVVDEKMIEKQAEIDKILFEQYKEEIAQKGITVTHTIPLNDFVEIGIIPYNKENVAYINEVLGSDMINIVQGEEAEIYTTMNDAPDTSVSSTVVDLPIDENGEAEDTVVKDIAEDSAENSAESSENNSSGIVFALIAVGVVTLGGIIIMTRKQKTIKK